jgi:hypothetical protein
MMQQNVTVALTEDEDTERWDVEDSWDDDNCF